MHAAALSQDLTPLGLLEPVSIADMRVGASRIRMSESKLSCDVWESLWPFALAESFHLP